ncbi:MAG: response regulator [Nitrospirae bacterium YQR-1]
MSLITLFSGSWCSNEDFERNLTKETGYRFLTEERFLENVSAAYNITVKKLQKSLYHEPSIFNDFTHDREKALAYIQLAFSELVRENNIIFKGFSAHIIPEEIQHNLKVCLITGINNRTKTAQQHSAAPEKEITSAILEDDNRLNTLTQYLFKKIPWDSTLYDILIPTDVVSTNDALKLVLENNQRKLLAFTSRAEAAGADFILSSNVRLALCDKGHDLKISSSGGSVKVIVDKYTIRLKKLEEEIKKIVAALPDVREVSVEVGPNFNDNIYRRYDFTLPSKVLVVDDEKDFALTLSNRLKLHDIGSAAVFSGKEALNIVEDEVPEILVLDLKMEGIDGIEVLRTIKNKYPGIEVIMLTGYGSEEDRAQAKNLGAFEYFEKPVNFENLMGTLKAAYEKISKNKNDKDKE